MTGKNNTTEHGKPPIGELETELARVRRRTRLIKLLRSTLATLVVVAAFAVLVAVIFLPVLRIYGSSMEPTLTEGQIVVSVKGAKPEPGDLVAVYYGSKVLVKRCIAMEHQWVNIDEDGNVRVDGEPLDEPYVVEKALGQCNITLPYQVPDESIFVMGDHRATSVDSRNTSVGCIMVDDVVGKIVFRIWPINRMGPVNKTANT